MVELNFQTLPLSRVTVKLAPLHNVPNALELHVLAFRAFERLPSYILEEIPGFGNSCRPVLDAQCLGAELFLDDIGVWVSLQSNLLNAAWSKLESAEPYPRFAALRSSMESLGVSIDQLAQETGGPPMFPYKAVNMRYCVTVNTGSFPPTIGDARRFFKEDIFPAILDSKSPLHVHDTCWKEDEDIDYRFSFKNVRLPSEPIDGEIPWAFEMETSAGQTFSEPLGIKESLERLDIVHRVLCERFSSILSEDGKATWGLSGPQTNSKKSKRGNRR